MLNNRGFVLAGSTFIFLAGLAAGSLLQSGIAHAQAAKHVYELRTYTAPEGKLGELHARFRDHTIRIFNKHGMKSVIYLAPQDAPDSANTLIYVLEHPSREAAKKAWADFQADPEWQRSHRIPGQRPHRLQGRVGVRGSDRLFADEVVAAMAMSEYTSIGDYIAAQPKATQAALRKVRSAIRKALPKATKSLSAKFRPTRSMTRS